MGGSQSSQVEKSTDIDSAGQVNNSFVFKNPVDVQSTEIMVILIILCVLEVLEVAYGFFIACKRRIRNSIRENERIRLQQTQVPVALNIPRASPRDGQNPV